MNPGRFYTFMEPIWAALAAKDNPQRQAGEVVAAAKAGARGLKILKTLGLYLRQDVTAGKLTAVDDPRFDPMWEACAAMRIPVAIHISDLLAFTSTMPPPRSRLRAAGGSMASAFPTRS